MLCVAPGCPNVTPLKYHAVCESCIERVKAAMLDAIPALKESMRTERVEAEAWLASDWTPNVRWVLCDDRHRVLGVAAYADKLAERLSRAGSSGAGLGFADPATTDSAWMIFLHSEVGAAWRRHVGDRLRDVLTEALSTFPLHLAGRELKAALTRSADYDDDDAKNAFDELWNAPDYAGLSEDALAYLELEYYPDRTWACEAELDGIGWFERWHRSRLLPAEIVTIMDAIQAHHASRSQ